MGKYGVMSCDITNLLPKFSLNAILNLSTTSVNNLKLFFQIDFKAYLKIINCWKWSEISYIDVLNRKGYLHEKTVQFNSKNSCINLSEYSTEITLGKVIKISVIIVE